MFACYCRVLEIGAPSHGCTLLRATRGGEEGGGEEARAATVGARLLGSLARGSSHIEGQRLERKKDNSGLLRPFVVRR